MKPTVQAKEWSVEKLKEFDEKLRWFMAGEGTPNDLKSFISSTLAEAHKIAYEEGARNQALLDAGIVAEARKEAVKEYLLQKELEWRKAVEKRECLVCGKIGKECYCFRKDTL
jgi:hypothetical protein